MKKHIILFACFAFLLISCKSNENWLGQDLGEIVFVDSNSKGVSSVNPVSLDYPGGRGPNDLVVYTPDYGKRTATNEWGMEAVVKDDYIISIGDNNSIIPKNGIVISGNETASLWINNNLDVGMKVVLTDQKITYSTSENTDVFQARSVYKKALKRIKENKLDYKNQILQFGDSIEPIFNLFKQDKLKRNVTGVKLYASQILNMAKNFYYQTFLPKSDEFRGVWIRLDDKTPEQLKSTIKKIADAGINAILPETIYNGYSIYPNAHDLMPQLPQFKGWDPMAVMVEECKKYNIKVIPWCEMFFIGGKNSPIARQKAEWLGLFRNGKVAAELEPGFQYLCPSRPETHKFLLSVLDTLLTRYDLSEIQLDYIRYSLSEPWEKGFCYCDYCRRKVKKQLHFDIRKITPENHAQWGAWNDYRANNITTFIKEVNGLIQHKHAKVKISADVFPDPKLSLEHKFQNWKSWVDNDMIDGIYIMSYSSDNRTIIKDSENMRQLISGSNVDGIVGIGPYLGFQPDLLLEQVEIARKSGAKGVCLFSFNALNKEQINALKVGPFRKL